MPQEVPNPDVQVEDEAQPDVKVQVVDMQDIQSVHRMHEKYECLNCSSSLNPQTSTSARRRSSLHGAGKVIEVEQMFVQESCSVGPKTIQ